MNGIEEFLLFLLALGAIFLPVGMVWLLVQWQTRNQSVCRQSNREIANDSLL